MGVPSFFKWLVSKFQDKIIFDHLFNNPTNPKTDILYLDFNCAIHPAVKQSHLKTLDDMYQAVIEYLDNIINIVQPSQLVYIAIDGVAPIAKMHQQRKRRFKSVQDKYLLTQLKQKHNIPIDDVQQSFDFNMISPGTTFMKELSIKLQQYINSKSSNTNNSDTNTLKFILSDADQPGEGEHKIMNHIRTMYLSNTNRNNNITIYGLDSDLIFLCLANFKENMKLFREKQYFDDKPDPNDDRTHFSYLDIGFLRYEIAYVMHPLTDLLHLEDDEIIGTSNIDESSQLFTDNIDIIQSDIFQQEMVSDDILYDQIYINDYIFMCFLLGNDFLPGLLSLKIREGGLDQLIRIYKSTQLQMMILNYNIITNKEKNNSSSSSNNGNNLKPINIINSNNSINQEFFLLMLKELYKIEEPTLQTYTKKMHWRISNFQQTQDYVNADDYHRELLEFEYVENKVKDTLQLGFNDWQYNYYLHYDNIDIKNSLFSNQVINDKCENYLTGMMWIFTYYLHGCSDWEWCYHYESPPLLKNLIHKLCLMDLNQIRFPSNNPVTAYQQLLCILPPESHALLPKFYADLMTNIKSPIIQYYPTNFTLDFHNNRYRWECYPLLPNLDYNIIKQTVRNDIL